MLGYPNQGDWTSQYNGMYGAGQGGIYQGPDGQWYTADGRPLNDFPMNNGGPVLSSAGAAGATPGTPGAASGSLGTMAGPTVGGAAPISTARFDAGGGPSPDAPNSSGGPDPSPTPGLTNTSPGGPGSWPGVTGAGPNGLEGTAPGTINNPLPKTGIPNPYKPGFDTAGYPLGGGTGLIDPFTVPAPGLANVPIFNAPAYTPPPAFKAPTLEEAQQEPGFQFGIDQAVKGVQASAAARGTLNSGGDLKDIYQTGLNYANQNYQNVYNRDANTWQLNADSQYVTPYKLKLQAAEDAFAPQMAAFGAQNSLNLNEWLQQYAIFRNRQIDSVNAGAATGG